MDVPTTVAVANELLEEAKRSGHDDRTWQLVIFPKLRASPGSFARPGSRTYNLLHQAAYWGNQAAVRVLLDEFGVDPTEQSRDGLTAAQVASSQGYADVAEFLRSRTLARGAEGAAPPAQALPEQTRGCSAAAGAAEAAPAGGYMRFEEEADAVRQKGRCARACAGAAAAVAWFMGTPPAPLRGTGAALTVANLAEGLNPTGVTSPAARRPERIAAEPAASELGPPPAEAGWPRRKLRSQLEALAGRRRRGRSYAAIMSTGALNPAHQGHVEMLRQAALRLQEAGYNVVCAFVSPSHDDYVQPKARNLRQVGLTQNFRLEVARLMTESDPLVDASSWEVDQRGFVDFPDVASAFDAWARENIPTEAVRAGLATRVDEVRIQTFYVCGTDHASGCGLQDGRMRLGNSIGVVIVPRAGEAVPRERKDLHVYVSQPGGGEVAGYSSTKVRKAIWDEDWDYVSRATSPKVRRLLSQPTDEERRRYEKDFEKLAAMC